jgi:hypothetical protein
MRVVAGCRERRLRTTVYLVGMHEEERPMTQYTNPALEAELAYRRQRLEVAARGRRPWRPFRRLHLG